MMHVSDTRTDDQNPDATEVILDTPYALSGRTVSHLELRLYMNNDDAGGPYCTITAYAHIDNHTIETTYDEGYRGDTPLSDAADFIRRGPGPAGIITRTIISLDAALQGTVDGDAGRN